MSEINIPIVPGFEAPEPLTPGVQRWLVRRSWSNGEVHESIVIATEQRAQEVVDDQNNYAHVTYGHELPTVDISPAPPEEVVESEE